MEWYYVLLIIIASILLVILFFIAPGNKRKCNDTSWLYKDYIAHRGVFNNEQGVVENTVSAFKKAIEKHYSIETDLHLTKDERIIVFHDGDFKRLCNVDKKTSELTLKEIKELKLLNSDEKILEFSEFLTLIDGNTNLLLEFKSQSTKRDEILCKKAMAILKDYKGLYAVQSFHPLIVKWFKKNYPIIARGQLFMVFNLKEEYKKAKGKTINKILSVFVKFMYNYKLTNVMARPVFITHNHKDINFMAKVVHLFVPMIIYTVDQDSDFVKYQNKVDNIIFEKIDIEKYGKKQTRNSTKSI